MRLLAVPNAAQRTPIHSTKKGRLKILRLVHKRSLLKLSSSRNISGSENIDASMVSTLEEIRPARRNELGSVTFGTNLV